ncbi:MAG: efflux RND transporter periplasmic adaptor subunit [Bacteroidaceae bacterium]|nr:efflux RND transporter periplasmic adaptor subunit [Bacteroidaceae bacterium]
MKKKVVFLLAPVLMMAGCQNKEDGQNQADQKSFETMTVSKQDITLSQSYPASVEGRQSVKIIPRIEGYLREIKVKEGQRVTKGQVLFVIDQASYQAEVKAAAANAEVAKANLTKEQLSYDGSKNLHAHKVVSDHELRTSASNLAMAKAQLQQAQAQLETARTNLSYTVLRSPSDGVVGSLPYRVGDYVSPTMQGALTTVADAQEMYVYFSLTERDVMSQIAEHGSLEKVVKAFPPISLLTANGDTCTVKGRVESVSGVVDNSTGSVSARAVFPNADNHLLSGSTGSIVIPKKMKQVIVIPQSATYEIQDKIYVYKVVDGKAESAIITVLPMNDGKNYVVISGLAVGDVIVAKGANYVKEGQEVKSEE